MNSFDEFLEEQLKDPEFKKEFDKNRQRYICLADLLRFPIRANHYDTENGNEHFIYGVETVLEYAESLPTVDAVPVTLINGRINDLKNMLINTDDDEKDEIWHLRTEIQTLKELLEMWADRKEE